MKGCTVQVLEDGRLHVAFDKPMIKLSGEVLLKTFKFSRECEVVSKGQDVIAVRAPKSLIEQYLKEIDPKGAALKVYKKSIKDK